MQSKIQVNVEKTFDRGPQYPYLEVQVNFEEKSSTAKALSFASVIVSLAKAEVGSVSFDEIRSMALSRALLFMENCIKSSASL
jgi:hypothetical protein